MNPHSPEQEDGDAVCVCGFNLGNNPSRLCPSCHRTAPPAEQVDAEGWTLWREKGEGWRLDQGELNSGLMGDVERVKVVRASERDNWRAAARGSAKRVASLWNRAQAAEKKLARFIEGKYHPPVIYGSEAKRIDAESRALQSTLDSQVAKYDALIVSCEGLTTRIRELETALREIAGVWPGEIGAEPKEDWRKTRARAALSPSPSERDS